MKSEQNSQSQFNVIDYKQEHFHKKFRSFFKSLLGFWRETNLYPTLTIVSIVISNGTNWRRRLQIETFKLS